MKLLTGAVVEEALLSIPDSPATTLANLFSVLQDRGLNLIANAKLSVEELEEVIQCAVLAPDELPYSLHRNRSLCCPGMDRATL